MSQTSHQHRHAVAAAPTLSLLRASAGQRLAMVSGVLAALWLLVFLAVD